MAEEHFPYRRYKLPPRMQVWIDGKFLFENDPLLTLSDWRNALYLGFTFDMRAHGTHVLRFGLYYDAFCTMLRESQFPDYVYLSAQMLQETSTTLLKRNRYHLNALVRLTCFLRYIPDLNTLQRPTTTLLIEAHPLEGRFYNTECPAVPIASYFNIRRIATPASSVRWLGDPLQMLARRFCTQRGVQDCLFYNERNESLQTLERDLFCIINDEVFASPLELGLVYDPFREVVKAVVQQAGFRFIERPLTQEMISRSTECFLGSTKYGIEPLKRIDLKYSWNNITRKQLIPQLNSYLFPDYFV